MNFSEALELIKTGNKMRRAGWPEDVFVYLVQGSEFEVNRAPLDRWFPKGTKVLYAPHIDVCIGSFVSVWEPQMMDILGIDWEIHG